MDRVFNPPPHLVCSHLNYWRDLSDEILLKENGKNMPIQLGRKINETLKQVYRRARQLFEPPSCIWFRWVSESNTTTEDTKSHETMSEVKKK